MLKKAIINILASATKRAIKREKPMIIAITGSFGKSSTKEAIAIAMGAREPGSQIRSSIKNYNNEFGVPFTVLGVHAPGKDPLKWLKVMLSAIWIGWGFGRIGANTLILEMGADHPGDLDWLVRIAPPSISVITSVAEAHSENFGSIEEVAKEKASLVRALPKDGLAILNNDDPRVTAMRKEMECEAQYFGFSEGSDIRVEGTEVMMEEDERNHAHPIGIRVALEIQQRIYELSLKGTIGRPQAWSVSCALLVARARGIELQKAIERLEKEYHGIPGRTRIIPGIKYTTLIDDSYNAASPKTVISAINDIAQMPIINGQRRICALGEMRELGEYSDSAHASVGEAVAKNGIDILVLCGTLSRTIADSAIQNGMDPKSVFLFEESAEAGRALQDQLVSGDIVLVKGSQGSRMEKIVRELMAEPLEAPFLLVRMDDEWQRIS